MKTNTPNTLTVQIPYAPVQSLPNLVPGSPQTSTPNQTLNDSPQHRPGSPMAPGRGISYPPLSPKSSLRRSKALPQQKSMSPPLVKSRPVGSDGITIPVITGVPAHPEDDNEILEEKSLEHEKHEKVPGLPNSSELEKPRKGRNDRAGADTRRYHTAGAIEDIKVSF